MADQGQDDWVQGADDWTDPDSGGASLATPADDGSLASKAWDTYKSGVSGSYNQLKQDIAGGLPAKGQAPSIKGDIGQMLSIGRLPWDAFTWARSLTGIPQAFGAANEAAGQGVAKILPATPQTPDVAKSFSEMLGTAEQLGIPAKGGPIQTVLDKVSPPGTPPAAPKTPTTIEGTYSVNGQDPGPVNTLKRIAAGEPPGANDWMPESPNTRSTTTTDINGQRTTRTVNGGAQQPSVATAPATAPAQAPGLGDVVGIRSKSGPPRRATVDHYFDNGAAVRLHMDDGSVQDLTTADMLKSRTAAPEPMAQQPVTASSGQQLTPDEGRPPFDLDDWQPDQTAPRPPTTAPLGGDMLNALDHADAMERAALNQSLNLSGGARQDMLAEAARLRRLYGRSDDESTPPNAYRHPLAGQDRVGALPVGEGSDYAHPMSGEPAADIGELAAARTARPDLFAGEYQRPPGELPVDPYALQDVQQARAPMPKGVSIFDAIRKLGGIKPDPGGDIAQIIQGYKNPPFVKRLVNPDGVPADDVRRALQEDGWFGRFENQFGPNAMETGNYPGDDIRDLYDLMDREARGEKVYHPESSTNSELAERAYADREMTEAGVTASDSDEDAAKKLAAYRATRGTEIEADHDQNSQDDFSGLPTEDQERLAEYGYEPGADIGAEHEEPEGAGEGAGGPEDWLEEPGDHAQDEGGAGDRGEEAAEGDTGQQPNRRPGVEEPEDLFATEPGAVDAQGRALDQTIIPGAEKSAKALAAAKEAAGHGKIKAKSEQKAPGGLFGEEAPPEPAQRTLFQPEDRFNRPFYSALTRGVEGLKFEKAKPSQWEATIKNLPGIKSEEIDWSGVNEWLRGQNKAVTKAEVLQHLRENEVGVQEVVLGGQSRENTKPDAKAEAQYGDDWEKLASQFRNINEQIARTHEDTALRDARPRLQQERDRLQDAMDELHDQMIEDTRERMLESGAAGQREPKYSTYVLPGGENYRELLLTLPVDEQAIAAKAAEIRARSPAQGGRLTEQEYRNQAVRELGDFKSSHFDEPNILAHVRFDDRTGPNGEKILHVAEIQSDWHQKGRRRGYQEGQAGANAAIEKIQTRLRQIKEENPRIVAQQGGLERLYMQNDEYRNLYDQMRGLEEAAAEERTRVPNAPFKTSWHELAMKRMLRYAAEHGYDRLSWDTGETQNARYDLSKTVSRLVVERLEDGRFKIEMFDKDGGAHGFPTAVEAKDLPDHVGKDMADKIVSDIKSPGGKTYAGLDLKVGGEGMKGFYDQILPQFLNKYGKKWGAKVEAGKVPSNQPTLLYEGLAPTKAQIQAVSDALHARPTDQRFTSPVTGERVRAQINRVSNENAFRDVMKEMERGKSFTDAMSEAGNHDLAEIFGGDMVQGEHTGSAPAHSIQITDAMRESVMRGQGMFQPGPMAFPSRAGEFKDLGPEFSDWMQRGKYPNDGIGLSNAVREYLLNRGAATDHEAIAFHNLGESAINHVETSGQPNFVEFSNDAADLLTDHDSNVILHHNHPSSRSLSGADIGTLAFPGVRWAIAHGHDGNWFAASLSPKWRNGILLAKDGAEMERNIRHLAGAWNHAADAMEPAFVKAVTDGRITTGEASDAHAHAVNVLMAQKGAIDYRTSKELAPHVQRVADEAIRSAGVHADRSPQPIRYDQGIADILGQHAERGPDQAGGAGRDQAGQGATGKGRVEQPGGVKDQTETPEFRRWFGNSKVVDADGKPLRVFHGSKSDITKFDRAKTIDGGFHLGTAGQASMRAAGEGKNITPVFAKIENPRRSKDMGGNWASKIAAAKSAGNDGIIYLNRYEGIPAEEFDAARERGIDLDKISDQDFRRAIPSAKDSYIAFEPTQIKSAVGNRGTFDPRSANIVEQPEDRFPKTPGEAADRRDSAADEMAESLRTAAPGTYSRTLHRMSPPSGDLIFKNPNSVENFTIRPETLARLDTRSATKWNAEKAKDAEANSMVDDLRSRIASTMLKLPEDSRNKVYAARELDRINGLVRSDTGHSIVARNDGAPFAHFSKPGQVVTLNPQETAAYHALSDMFDRAWKNIMEGAARKVGWTGPWDKEDMDANLRALNHVAETSADDKGLARVAQRAAQIVSNLDAQRRQGYHPLMRFGDYYAHVTPKIGKDMESTGGFPKTVWFELAERGLEQDLISHTRVGNQAAPYAEEMLKRLQAKFPADQYNIEHGFLAKNPDMLDRVDIPAIEKLMTFMENDMLHSLRVEARGKGMSKADARDYATQKYDDLYGRLVDQLWEKAFQELQAGYRKKASTVPGYSSDFDRALGTYMHWTSRNVADQIHRPAIDEADSAMQTDPRVNSDVKRYWKAWTDYQRSPSNIFNKSVNGLARWGFLTSMGVNPSSTAVVGTHGLFMAGPTLSVGLGMKTAAPAYARAMKHAMGALKVGRDGLSIPDVTAAGRTPGEKAFLQRLDSEGILHSRAIEDMAALNEKQSSLWGSARSKARKFMDIALSNVSVMDRANRIASALSAYRLAGDPATLAKMDQAWRVNQIWREQAEKHGVNQESMASFMVPNMVGEYGKMNQAPIERNAFTRMMMGMHGFVTRLLSKMWQMGSMSPAGRQGLLWTMGAFWLMAGLDGEPFAEDVQNAADFIWKAATGKDPMLGYRIQADLASMFGKAGANMLLYGPASALSGADLHSRLGMGDLISRNWPTAENTLGAYPSIILGRVRAAVQDIGQGNYGQAATEALPAGVRNAAKAIVEREKGIRTGAGRVEVPANQLTPADTASRALGFTPEKAEEAYQRGDYRYRARRARMAPPPNPIPPPGYAKGGRVHVNPTPSDAQIEAGNYKKGHLKVHGFDISIETPKGVARRGVGADGKAWENTHPSSHYGYLKRTEGADGEHVDCYVGPHESYRIFIVDQFDPKTRRWDEHKLVFGARTIKEAKTIYDHGFSDGSGPRRRRHVHQVSPEELKAWLNSSDTARPFVEAIAA